MAKPQQVSESYTVQGLTNGFWLDFYDTTEVPEDKAIEAVNYYRCHPEEFDESESYEKFRVVKNVTCTTSL